MKAVNTLGFGCKDLTSFDASRAKAVVVSEALLASAVKLRKLSIDSSEMKFRELFAELATAKDAE